jgi:hypothetical protein
MLPASWKPAAVGELVRLGGRNDGGYVVAESVLATTTTLLSLGLADDWSFERDFRARSGARVICVDGTVHRRFWIEHFLVNLSRRRLRRAFRFAAYRRFFAKPRAEHRRLMVGYDGPQSVSLDTMMRELEGESVFLKCDIEGAEYRVLDHIVAHAGRLTGIAMELHAVDLHRDRISAFLAALPDFRIAHLHGNNFGGTDTHGDPLVIEISLVRTDLLPGSPRSCAIDSTPNRPDLPDLTIRFAGGGDAVRDCG